ncbi:MAG: hypothetical protein JST81_15145 [Bacteroidetes bacterium]|nr:hypothetical protein [Bacteroidota bacterium]
MNKTKSTSIAAINKAIETLTTKGIAPTQKNVQVETGLSIATIKRNWKHCIIHEMVLNDLVQQLKDKGVDVCTDCVIPSRVSVLNESKDNRVSDMKDRVSHSTTRVSDNKGRVSPSNNRVSSLNTAQSGRISSFERLKRRKPIDEIVPYRPWLNRT